MRGINHSRLSWAGHMRVSYHRLLSSLCLAAALVLIPLSAKGTDFGPTCSLSMKSVVRIFQNESKTVSFASGVIVNKDGTILTCNHVVDGLGKIDVMFGEGITNSVYSAKIIKRDQKLDLALIQIIGYAGDLRPMEMSKLPTPLPGTPVAAIGAPLKVFRTVTAGVVSYCGQDEGQEVLVFDAKVMPGCSGGPVIDEQGDLMGLITGTIGRGEYTLSRAVYISEIERFINTSQRGFLGVSTTPVNSGIAGPNCSQGLRVDQTPSDGELKPGDVIMTFNDYQANSHNDLVRMVRRCTPGDRVEVGILRNGEFKLIHMIIKELRK